MKTLNKIYWHIKNIIYSWGSGSGILPTKKDDRDRLWSGIGYKRKHDIVDLAKTYVTKLWRFIQNPFNICVFAAAMLAASCQDGIRWSVRWMVKLAVREGRMVYRNGFSYLRAPKKLAKKYGMLPYELMPDETNMSWREYCKWTPEDDKLLKVAEKYKISEYKKIRTTSQAYVALDKGYTLCTGNTWYSGMFNPRPPDYKLIRSGRVIGGHAYYESGYDLVAFIMTNSFGLDWGNKGQGRDMSLFEKGDFAIYTQEKLTLEQRVEYLTTYHEGKIVKGSKAPLYLIKDGSKKAFKTWEQYLLWCSKNAVGSNSYALVMDDMLEAVPYKGLIE